LTSRHPKMLAKRRGVRRLRESLRHESEGAAERALSESGRPAGAVAELQAMRVRVERWQLAQQEAADALEPALERLYATGRKRMRRAAKAKGSARRARTLHE